MKTLKQSRIFKSIFLFAAYLFVISMIVVPGQYKLLSLPIAMQKTTNAGNVLGYFDALYPMGIATPSPTLVATPSPTLIATPSPTLIIIPSPTVTPIRPTIVPLPTLIRIPRPTHSPLFSF